MKKYIWIIFLFFLNFKISGNINNISNKNILNYHISDGLSGVKILDIKQDHYGYIWIATTDGLSKFDGNYFTNYNRESFPVSISDSFVENLFISKDSSIWISTPNGLNIYNHKDSKIRTYGIEEGLPSSGIIYTFNINDDIIVATYQNGLFKYNNELDRFENYYLQNEKHNNNKITGVSKVFYDNDNILWIGTNVGVYRYDIKDKKLNYFSTKRVEQIKLDSEGNIWIIAGELYLYEEIKESLKKIDIISQSNPNRIYCMAEDDEGYLWLGSDAFLAYIKIKELANDEKPKLNYIKQKDERYNEDFLSVNNLFFDKNKNLWIGTYGRGLKMIESKSPFIRLLKKNKLNNQSLSDDKINNVTYSKDGLLYVSTNGFGIDILDSCYNKIANLKPDNSDFTISDIVVRSVYFDNNNNLWIANFNNGLDFLDYQNRISINYNMENTDHTKRLPSNDIRSIFQSSDGTMWIGTVHGFGKINNDGFDNSFIDKYGYYDVRVIEELNDSIIILGTYGGRAIFYNHLKNNINYVFYEDKTFNIVYDICINDNVIYLALYGLGIYALDAKNFELKHFYDNTNLLPDNYVQSIYIVDNNLWVSTNNNIININVDLNIANVYSNKDGIQINGLNPKVASIIKDSCLYLAYPGNDGVNIIDINSIEKYELENNEIIITSLEIKGIEYLSNSDLRIFNSDNINISESESITLSHDNSTFTLRFSDMKFSLNKKNYIYKLIGLNDEWIDVPNDMSLNFKDLKSGNYTLEIKEKSDFTTVTKKIDIKILYPLWLRWYSIIFYIILFCCMIALGIYIIRLKLKAKKVNDKRTREIEIHNAKLQFFTNISHELRTPLTLILGPSETILKSPVNESIKTNALLINRNTKKLLSLVNTLLDFRKTEIGYMKLSVKYMCINELIKEIVTGFNLSNKFDNNIHIYFNEEDKVYGYFDSNFIERILLNLISNSIKYAVENGAIEVSLVNSESEDCIALYIKDNGKGIIKSDLDKIFNLFYQNLDNINNGHDKGYGIGLNLVKNLVAINHGDIQVFSEVNNGTCFKIILPYKKESFYEEEINEISESSDKYENEESDICLENNLNDKSKILLVEDNNDIKIYLESILHSEYNIYKTSNGKEAIEFLETNECDLVVSDIMMPEMNGIELCKYLKSNIALSHIPIILLTAKTSTDNRIEGLDAGADSYIPKPFNPEHLKIRIIKLLETRKLLREKYSHYHIINNDIIESKSSDEDIFISKLYKYINDNIDNSELNGDTIGRELGMSRMSLHRKLKSLTGCSTTEFLRGIRLQKAGLLLQKSNKTILEVCYEVGFSSPTYFSTCFLNYHKLTPSEFQRKNKISKELVSEN